MKSSKTLYLSSKLRCMFVRFDIFASSMHKVKLDDFFNTWHVLISEGNLAGIPMLKIFTEKNLVFRT